MKYVCSVCAYVYDEAAEGVPWDELPDDWTCPVCTVDKALTAKVRAGDLLSAIERTGESIEKDHMSARLDTLLSNIDTLKKIVLKTSESIHIIHVKDIIRCEADVNYTHFYLEGNKHLIVSKPLKDYADLLEPAGFFRTHQSHLINMEHILRYDRSEGGSLVMDDESCIPVSTRKKEALFSFFEQM